jgi:hypothetical protein
MAIQDILIPPKPGTDKDSSIVEAGQHNISVADVLKVADQAVTPHTVNEKTFADVRLAPAVTEAKPCSLEEADRAEAFADRMAADVKNGVRKLRAAAKVRMAEAELQTGMRAYQAIDANAALLKAKANGRLASHLLKHRKDWAQLGYGVQRQVTTTNQEVEAVRYRYLGA